MGFWLMLLGSPNTGDHRNVFLYIIIAAVALLLMLVYVLLGKKGKKK